ncbi:MAG: peptidoglycan DD-metalloendopeptidase family protein [Pseudomonadota bacterium]|nr:peptidoglycan DD-metalloendopeptidase family protein [Pseudomonadota bacterium]
MTGCASRPTVVVPAANERLIQIPEFYTVKRGDTLSAIALRYRLDYRDIGRINNLDRNYTIYTGQQIRLRGRRDKAQVVVRTPPSVAPQPRIQTQTLPKPTVRPQPTVVSPPSVTAPRQSTAQGLVWQWPTSNPILQEFNASQQIKGTRFDGLLGDPVLAAAAGEVVYASDGLTEYGNLVLIRHANGYITAYAHNQRLLVQEGQRVTIGQPVAEMGRSGTTRIMLEFQVRKDGKPINPKQVLPRR